MSEHDEKQHGVKRASDVWGATSTQPPTPGKATNVGDAEVPRAGSQSGPTFPPNKTPWSNASERTTSSASPFASDKSHPTSSPRLTPMPAVLDVGEQVFGSSHVFEVRAPFNLGPGGALLSATLASQESPFAIESAPAQLDESGKLWGTTLDQQLNASIKIRFSPVADREYPRKHFSAELRVFAKWPDGATEVRVVFLRGHARKLGDKPNPPRSDADVRRNQTERAESAAQRAAEEQRLATSRARAAPYPQGAKSAFDHEHDMAAINARSLANRQRTGVEVASKQIGSYRPPPLDPSFWWDLVRAAVMLGVGRIAGQLAKYLANELAAGFTKPDSRYADLPDIDPGAEQPRYSVLSPDALVHLINEGLVSGAAAALALVSPKSITASSSADVQPFFEAQLETLDRLAYENERVVAMRKQYLEPLLGTSPQSAIDAMSAIKRAFESTLEIASQHQKAATSAEWLALRARAEFGSEQVPSADGRNETVTRVDGLSAISGVLATKVNTPSAWTGVLDLVLDVEHGPPHVVRAATSGVAQSVADDLRELDLASARVPIRIIVGWNEPLPTLIFRDEAGRVRVSGDLERLSRFDPDGAAIKSEVQAERAARMLLDVACSRTLTQWGARIVTDDRSGSR